MKVLENNYEDPVFPKKVECEHCGSILELERDDCNCVFNKFTYWYTYHYTCPCCKNECKFDDLL